MLDRLLRFALALLILVAASVGASALFAVVATWSTDVHLGEGAIVVIAIIAFIVLVWEISE